MARTADRVDLTEAEGRLESLNPATGEAVGTVRVTPPEEVEAVAAEVARIQPAWGMVPLEERAAVIARAVDDLLDRQDEITGLVTRESGKTLAESTITEIGSAALELGWVAKHAPRYLSPERLPDHPLVKQKTHWILYRPLGVVGVIGPWNYPFMLPAAEIAFALVAGNGVVFKPSEFVPLVGDEIARVFSRAGLPEGLLRVVHGRGETGAAVCAAPSVGKVFFTGSVPTGQKVLEAAAGAGKTAVLELGGKDPAIVCADADLDRAVAGTLWAGTTNCGQTCAAVERIYVDRRVHDEFVRRLVEAAKEIRSGDPRDPATQVGPMNNDMQYGKVVEHLEDAKARGATVECGGPVGVPGLQGRFIAPTVLTGVDHSMKVMTEETFGPLIPVMPFESEQEAVRMANDSPYGLGASVWSRDKERARMLAERIEAGMVWINDHAYSHGLAQTPWGGVKSSGNGVTHSKFGFYDMVQKRLLAEDAGRLPSGWWYPYDDAKRRGFAAVVESFTRSGLGRRLRAAWDRRGEIRRYARGLFR